jgi:hypothetical protein
MERPERALRLGQTEYKVMFTGVTDTVAGTTHMAVRFTDPQTGDHFHVRFRVPSQTDPVDYFPRIPSADLESALRDALGRAATRPVP